MKKVSLELKWGSDGIYAGKGLDLPVPGFYDDIVAATKAFCRYVYDTYGRMPKGQKAMFIPILTQIHHLDNGFYEKYLPDYLTTEDRDHMRTWHSDAGA